MPSFQTSLSSRYEDDPTTSPGDSVTELVIGGWTETGFLKYSCLTWHRFLPQLKNCRGRSYVVAI